MPWPDRKTARLGGALGVVALGFGGCGTAELDVPRAATTDSAGIEIVTYQLADTEPAVWRTAGEADLRIGVVDGAQEYAFSWVDDVAVAEGGSIVVVDRQTRQLRLFGADGVHLRSLGGAGGGPGEFSSPPRIAGLAGDTIFAYDRRSARLTSFAWTGELLTERSMRVEDIGRPAVVERQSDGTLLTQSRWVNPASESELHDFRLVVDSIVVERLSATVELLDTILVGPETPRARSVMASEDGGFRVRQAVPPYSPTSHLATVESRAVFAFSSDFDVAVYDTVGALERRIRVLGVRHPATRDDLRASQEAELVAELGEDGLTPEIRLYYLEFIPESPPAFGRLLGAATGDVWVSLFDPDEGMDTTWLVFSPEGALRGSVVTPARLSVRWIGERALVGVETDEFDVPFVVRYPLLDAPADG